MTDRIGEGSGKQPNTARSQEQRELKAEKVRKRKLDAGLLYHFMEGVTACTDDSGHEENKNG